MTHYHLYIECGAIIDANSHFYRVAIGQSGPENSLEHAAPSVQYIRGHDLLRGLNGTQAKTLNPHHLHNKHQMSLTLNLDYRISSRIAANR